MKTSGLAGRIRNRIRKANGTDMRTSTRRTARKLVMESMEQRCLLAADLLLNEFTGDYCLEGVSFADESAGTPILAGVTKFEGNSESDLAPPSILPSGLPTPEVMGTYVYHHNSVLAGLGMESALDTTKQLAKESEIPTKLNFQNLLSSTRGINGLVIDVIHLPSETLTVDDFYFQVSPVGVFNEMLNPAVGWQTAPAPEQITVTKDQDSDISRISIHWADNAISNRWLRMTLLSNSSTGLSSPEVYYVGHLQGKSTNWTIQFDAWNPSGVYEVHSVDRSAIRQQVGQAVDAGSVYDVNKDGIISFLDIAEMRNAEGMRLSNITVSTALATVPLPHVMIEESDGYKNFSLAGPGLTDDALEALSGEPKDTHEDPSPLAASLPSLSESATEIVGSYVYHRNSDLAVQGMEDALDSYKRLAKEAEEPQTLSIQNLTNSSRGINGLVFDLSRPPNAELTAADFQFQVSPMGAFNELRNPAVDWNIAPSPELISVHKEDVLGVVRVSIHWEDHSIMNRWLRITFLANANTGLATDEVFYIGHLHGKNTDWLINFSDWNPSGVYEVHQVDTLAIRQQVGQSVDAGSAFDVNKDGIVSFRDVTEMRHVVGTQLSNITIVAPASIPLTTSSPDAPGSSENTFSDKNSADGFYSQEMVADDVHSGSNESEFEGDTLVVQPPQVLKTESQTSILGGLVYHRNSVLAQSGMENALDTTKQLVKETDEATSLGIENLISSNRGINGLVFGLIHLPSDSLTEADFRFQVSPTGAFNELEHPAVEWEAGPAPELISVTHNEQLGVSIVAIHWADGAIMNRWLRITFLANTNTGLAAQEVYYIGHLQGKSTDWMIEFGDLNPSGVFEVHPVDTLAIRGQVGQIVDAGSVYDVNKDGMITFRDIIEMRDAVGIQLSNITVSSVASMAAPAGIAPAIDEATTLDTYEENFLDASMVLTETTSVGLAEFELKQPSEERVTHSFELDKPELDFDLFDVSLSEIAEDIHEALGKSLSVA